VALENSDFRELPNESSISRNFVSRSRAILPILFAKKFSRNSYFSLLSSNSLSMAQITKLLPSKESIIHIHNWFNFLSLDFIDELLASSYQVVITLHDQRFLTGACHYSLSCRKFENGCNVCPELPFPINRKPSMNFERLSESFNKSKNLTLVAPSRWLLDEMSKSPITQRIPARYIPNTLGVNFLLQNFKNSPDRIGKRKIRIGVAGSAPEMLIKGGDLISELTSAIKIEDIPWEIVFLQDYFENTINFWNSIDCLLVPSRADNSPNVIHEAKNFGIPVIATNVGGISELLSKNYDISIDLKNLDLSSIKTSISTLEKRDLRFKIRSEINKEFLITIGDPTAEHIKLYQSILKP
jgi:glycosyltransferase involved in cell wall biosynthesis